MHLPNTPCLDVQITKAERVADGYEVDFLGNGATVFIHDRYNKVPLKGDFLRVYLGTTGIFPRSIYVRGLALNSELLFYRL